MITKERAFLITITVRRGFPDSSFGKEPTYNAGDTGETDSTPESGSSPAGGNGNPLQCSCLGNPMDRGAWGATVWVAKNWTGAERLSVHTVWYQKG